MDIGFNSVHWTHPGSVGLAMLFVVIYGLWCLITIVLRRSERPAFLALMPFFVTVPVAWVDYAALMHVMAFSAGGGRASLATGNAEVLVLLGVGAGVTAGLTIVALLRGPRQGTSLAASALAAAVIAALAGVTIWFAAYAFNAWPSHVPSMRLALAGSIVTAIVIVAYLLLAWRRKLYPSAIAVAASAALVAIVARLQFEIYWRIAVTG